MVSLIILLVMLSVARSEPPVTVVSGSSAGKYSSLAVDSLGFPCISYYDETIGAVMFVRAASFLGSTWDIPYEVDNGTGDVGTHTSLVIVQSNPAIAYRQVTPQPQLKYVRSDDAEGTSWSNWVVVDTNWMDDPGEYASLALCQGHPCVAYYVASLTSLYFARATDTLGSTWQTPAPVDGINAGTFASLATVNERPAISYRANNVLGYRRADDPLGNAWTTSSVFPSQQPGSTSLAVINGVPAMVTFDASTGALVFQRAADVNGSSWDAVSYTVDATGGAFAALTPLANGFPAVAYSRSARVYYARGANVQGTLWEPPTQIEMTSASGDFNIGLALVLGRPAISYYLSTTTELAYAIAYDALGDYWLTTAIPSTAPTAQPSNSLIPTKAPTSAPSAGPSASPSTSPSASPSTTPTVSPSKSPSAAPTVSPTALPTTSPSGTPSSAPTVSPTAAASQQPTQIASQAPSASPTGVPTSSPTAAPSSMPTSTTATQSPSRQPSASPTSTPTVQPTSAPTTKTPSTAGPTGAPSASPTDASTVPAVVTGDYFITGAIVIVEQLDLTQANQLTVNGSLTLAPDSQILVGSSTVLNVSGSLVLDGALSIQLASRPDTPVLISVASASSISGSFAVINGSVPGGISSCESLAFAESRTGSSFSVAVSVDSSGCGLHPGIIAAIAIGIVLLALVLVILLVRFVKGARAKKTLEMNEEIRDNELGELAADMERLKNKGNFL